jgi:hypothetical protein
MKIPCTLPQPYERRGFLESRWILSAMVHRFQRAAAQLVIRHPWGYYPQGHEYPDPLRRMSASQVFFCSKYRLLTNKNQLQAAPKVAGAWDETRRRNGNNSKPRKRLINAVLGRGSFKRPPPIPGALAPGIPTISCTRC